MFFRVPSYYNTFKCTADKCSDNCCIGWEIDIDVKTREYYSSLSGEFGRRLSENISDDNSFILQGERCPFLNSQNLCDIIINCGEEHLCQICRDHPRYFEWYGNIKEGGIGLSCEEGARLILTNDSVSIVESEVNEEEEYVDSELFTYLMGQRKILSEIIDDSSLSLKEKLGLILDSAEKIQFSLDNIGLDAEFVPCDKGAECDFTDILELYSDFEPIDESWSKELEALLSDENSKETQVFPETEKYILNLCRYFIWRYFLKGVFDEEILSKVKFAVVSALAITVKTRGEKALSVWIEKSKLYSKQMEYSDENRELFYDYCYEKDCLTSASLKKLIDKIK